MKDYRGFSIIGIWFGIGLICLSIVMSQLYNMAYSNGGVVGYNMALDTVSKIMENNVQCDTCVSKATIVTNRDTVTYYISKKLFKK